MTWLEHIRLILGIKCLGHFFSTIVLYSIGENKETVGAIHFAKDEETLRQSIKELASDKSVLNN